MPGNVALKRGRIRQSDEVTTSHFLKIDLAAAGEIAARRCARSMKINVIRIRDPWANRRLAICARSFKTLPRPAKQLVEYLRKAAQH